MNEIICPNCKKAFKVDEAGFADIVKQVRDHQFQEELENRLHLAEKEKENAVKLAEANLKNKLQEELANKDKEIIELKAKSEKDLSEQLAKKETELASAKAKLDNAETEKKLSVSEAIKAIEKERDDLANSLSNKETEKQLLEKSLKEKFDSDTIVIAGVKDDRVNDKNEVVFQKFSKLMSDMTNKKIMVMSPFWGSTKEQIVGWYLKNGGIKEALLSTISCYSSEDILFCGKCPACFRKWCALKANGIDDLIFTNDKLMWNYYDKAVEGSYYDPDRNRNIIEQVLKIHPNWEGLW